MADPVELPTLGADASPLDVFEAIAVRLASVANVLEAEQKWFGSIIDYTRQIDGGEEVIASELDKGWIDDEEAERRRTIDEPHILKAQADMHRRNLNSAVLILRDASRALSGMIGKDEESPA